MENSKKSMSGGRKGVLIGIGSVFLIGIAFFTYEHLMYVSTDNAMVQAHTIMLAPKVSGMIVQVSVDENQKVKAGQLLAKIDERDYQNTLNQVQDEMESMQAGLADAEKNYKRLADLYKKGAVSQQQFDSSEAKFKEINRKVASLEAQVEQAKLNLSYTEVKAPSDGIIARKSAEVGMFASVGQPLLGFVDGGERWVMANFKETELPDVVVGKKADVTVDALPGKSYHGTVESLSPSTGATFTLLPPDNATGNFTKVVQRVPVRIKLQGLSEQDVDKLQAGLSALVSVHVH